MEEKRQIVLTEEFQILSMYAYIKHREVQKA
jgi:hypothetical protein